MGLKTLVKVSEVNNLSDARYCAGMGVEMIGFSLDENHPKFIEAYVIHLEDPDNKEKFDKMEMEQDRALRSPKDFKYLYPGEK